MGNSFMLMGHFIALGYPSLLRALRFCVVSKPLRKLKLASKTKAVIATATKRECATMFFEENPVLKGSRAPLLILRSK